MATQTTSLGPAWEQLAVSVDTLIIQSRGTSYIYFGASAPSSTETGFQLRSGQPQAFSSLSSLGGSVWAKAVTLIGSKVVHASG